VRTHRTPIMVLALFVLSAIAAGCAGAPAPTDTPAPTGTLLAPGLHASTVFGEPLSYRVPVGWENPSDSETYFQIRPAGSELAAIHIFLDPFAASQAESCPGERQPYIGTTSSELAAWIADRAGLAVSRPILASVGGLTGVMLDIRIAEGWRPSCPFADGLPTVPLITRAPGGYHWIVAGNERLRLYLLDRPGGGTVVVDIDAFDGRLFDELLRQAAPVVDSFSFTGR
jgi:hypothetical protein